MTARFICRKDINGFWRISYRDGQLLGRFADYNDALAEIRAIHGRTVKVVKPLTKEKP